MSFFPEELYVLLRERAGDPDAGNSHTKHLLEKGSSTIVRKLIEKSAQTAEAAMDQDLEMIAETVGDLWYLSLVTMLYYGITPDQVESYLLSCHKKSDPRKRG